jgi:hypothetical protein
MAFVAGCNLSNRMAGSGHAVGWQFLHDFGLMQSEPGVKAQGISATAVDFLHPLSRQQAEV